MRHTEASCTSVCCQAQRSLCLGPWLQAQEGLHPDPSHMIEFTTCLVLVPNRPHVDTVHGRLGVLSEQSVQKWLQLSSSQQNSQSRETGSKQSELEQLRRENQVYTFNVENTP